MLQQHPAHLDTVSDLLASLIIQSVYRKIMSDQHQPSQQTAPTTASMEVKSEMKSSNEDASNVADAPEMDTLIDLSDITQPAAAASPFATVAATSSSLSVIQQSSSSSSYSSASSVDDSSSTTSADTIVLTTSYNNDDNDNENIIDTCSDNNTRNNINNNENVTTLGDTTDSMDTVTRAFATNLQLLEREVAKLDAEDTTSTVTETTITRGLVATPVGGGKSGDTVKDQTESNTTVAQTPPKIKPYIIFEPSDSEEEVDIPVRLPPHPSDITGKSAATPPSSVPSPKAAQSTVQIGAATPPSSSITIPQSAPLQIGTWRDQTYDADEISSQSYDDDSDDDEISSEDNKSEGLVPRTTTPTNFGSSSSGTAVTVGTSAGASTSGGGGGGSPSAANLLNLSQEYHLKWIKWKGNTKCPIVTQNSNGPCPLLAIMNVLLMRKNICFPPMIEIITAEQLMDYLCDFILSNVPTNLPEGVKLDFEQNFQDAMSILPRLSTGLDVNVRFTGISDFEYTSECIIFDLLRIPLYHGWLVDPEDTEVFRVVNTLSYNQLVDKIIANKGSADPDINSQMFIAEEFLNQSASQLTNHGLVQLIQRVKEDELCILFRNNHFITLYKYKGKLFQLVTDQGFLTEPNVVWESLNNIEGDTYFVDGDFVLVPPKPAIAMAVTPFVDTQQQIDQDYLIALSLEQEQKQEWERTAASAPDGSTSSTSTSTGSTGQTVLPSPSTSIGKGIVPVDSAPPPRIMSHSSPPAKTTSAISSVSKPPLLPVGISDEEMARRLQEEEDQMFQRMQREREQQQQRQRGGGGGGGGVPRQPTQHPQQRYGGGSASTVPGSYSGGLTGGSNRMSSAMSNHYDSRSSSGQYRTASHHHQGAGGGGTGSTTSGASTGGSTAHSRHPRSGSGSSASGSATTNRPHENDEGNDSNNRSGSSRSNSKNCIIS